MGESLIMRPIISVFLPLILFLTCSPSFAVTTLHLDDHLELLVLDGKKVAPTLLLGADNLELDNGLHQLIIRQSNYSAEIITVDTSHIRHLYFSLADEGKRVVGLHDEHNALILTRIDSLNLYQDNSGDCHELAAWRYNQSHAVAAVAKFARQLPDNSCLR